MGESIKSLNTIPTVKLVDLIGIYKKEDNQDMVNLLAYELTCRIYVPNKGTTFDELAYRFGYREIEHQEKDNARLV